MRTSIRFAVAVTLALLVPSGAATAASLVAGEYVPEGGWGTLTLTPGKNGALLFLIETVGANGHMCGLDGEVREGRVTLETMEGEEPCLITMEMTPEGVDVQSSTSEACRFFCGARAGFEALYLRQPASCTRKTVAATRGKFKKLYDAKRFGEARAALHPLLTECSRYLDRFTEAWIRNDLAITLHKLGALGECRAVLEPLEADARMTDEELRENYPPSDAEMWMPIVRAARTNLRLCREK